TARHHVAAVDVMIPGYTSAGQFREACVRVANDAQWIVIDRQWTPDFFHRVFPALRDPAPPEERNLEAVVPAACDRAWQRSSRFEVRTRSESAARMHCGKV